MKSISEIKNELALTGFEELPLFILEHRNDDRSGVINLVNSAQKKYDAYKSELERLDAMKQFERKYDSFSYICGIDEVGRGPLAGPVMAGAVILPKDCEILYLNDSKKVSHTKRAQIEKEIKEKAIAYNTAIVSNEEIDDTDILKATKKAMKMAIEGLKVKPDVLFIDAVNLSDVNIKQISIIKGDAKSVSIAAASIIAKEERDRIMEEYDRIYPEYGFASNKGYGSAKHIEAIKKYGPCPIHRKTFIGNFI